MNILMSYNKNEGYGAIGRYVELVNNLLKKNDINIFYISPYGYDRSTGKNFTHLGYKKINFKPNFLYAWLMVIFITIKNFSKFRKIEKCILFNGSNSFIFAFLKNFFKYELIYSVRVNIIYNGSIDTSLYNFNVLKLFLKKIQFKFYKILENYILKKSDKIVFQSKINASEYRKMYNIVDSKTFILKNNCNPLWVGGKRKLKLNNGFNIGFIGNLFMNKGVKVIIDAFQLVTKEKPKCFLTIIGDGPDRKYFKTYVRNSLLNNVSFLGHKKNAFELMYNFDLIVVPSFMEAFPNVILEALYYKIPVLGSKVGGIPLILKEKYLFNPGDHSNLSSKILNLLQKNEYQDALKYVSKNRKNFLFDWGGEFYKIISS